MAVKGYGVESDRARARLGGERRMLQSCRTVDDINPALP